ncbi:MAG: phenylalanine--tRNA ligase subunit beta [Planctomycetota bacterium]|nr:phenylalanine--tRNA ligase subunit beta [Planctomycetota bacterium]
MKISLNWLNDYVRTELPAQKIADIISDLGFPYEGIEYLQDDAVIDFEITSNRGDCLSHIGIARELAAAVGKELKLPAVEIEAPATSNQQPATDLVSVEINEPNLCYRYTARVITGVKIGTSPDWLIKRLEAVGMRSVNNVVDATNYAMMETGQPPHAFDYDKITQKKIIVRKAIAGEQLISIDGSKCELTSDMLVIADAKRAVAIAGIMGGLDTEVGDKTTTILLEEAYFDPVSIRTTSRKLSLPSEAAFRFERIVDVEKIDWASKRTAQLIVQLAGGKIAGGLVDCYPVKPSQKQVTIRLSRLNHLLGIKVPHDHAVKILSALSFQPRQNNESLICTVPSWRSDVYREADLIEEVARVYGYDKVPAERKIEIEVVPVDARQKLVQSIGTYLNGCGFYETINVTFIDNSTAALFSKDAGRENLAVRDVARKGDNILRSTLIGSLLGVLKTNLNVKNTPCRIFEIADTFVPSGKDAVLPIEKTRLTLVCDGDLRDLRGVIEGLLKNINKTVNVVFTPADLFWANLGAQITANGRIIGTAGIVSQVVKDKFDFKTLSPCAAELELDELLVLHSGPVKIRPIPRFPAIERDLSLVVDEQIAWADIIAAVNKKVCSELEDVRFVGIYRGKGIAVGKKSLTLSLRFRDEDGTLTHDTVDGFEKAILNSLTVSIGAELRTS